MSEQGKADLNKALLDFCDKELLGDDTVAKVSALLKQGAEAKYSRRVDGTWGAYDARSPIHGVLDNMTRVLFNQDNHDKTTDPSQGYENCIQVLKLLLDNGADVNAVKASYDWRGCGHSTTALEQGINIATRFLKPDLLELMLKNGGDANAVERCDRHSMRTDGYSKTPVLVNACSAGSVECVKVLLKHGADPHARAISRYHNERGYHSATSAAPIHACLESRISEADIIKVTTSLLKAGANVNAVMEWLEQRDNGRTTPHDDPRSAGWVCTVDCVPQRCTQLHRALHARMYDLATVLYAWGADFTFLSMDGKKESTVEDILDRLRKPDEKKKEAKKPPADLFLYNPELAEYFPEGTDRREMKPAESNEETCRACEWVVTNGAPTPCVRCTHNFPLAPRECEDAEARGVESVTGRPDRLRL